jgi:hypothetical protein
MARRPVGRFASAEVGTAASTNSREESVSFGRDKTRAPSGMLRVPVASDQKPWTQGLEKKQHRWQKKERGAEESRWQTLSKAMEGLQGGQQ